MAMNPKVRKVLQSDAEAWQTYRLYQRDVLTECIEDAELMMRRMRVAATDDDRRLVVQMLLDKRCAPWNAFRNEQRALVAR